MRKIIQRSGIAVRARQDPDEEIFSQDYRPHHPIHSAIRRGFRAPWVRKTSSRLFWKLQNLGFNITPNHFYFPIPNHKTLKSTVWTEANLPAALDLKIDQQEAHLRNWAQFIAECRFQEEPRQDSSDCEFHFNNGFFERVDAEVAYSIVRKSKPRTIIEVGSGSSTRLLATAVRKNAEEGYPAELISIDPHPDPSLLNGFPGLTAVYAVPVQQISIERFAALVAGDVLFIDSTHSVSLGSDVVHEILRLLPILKPGVLVHFHDIFLPLEYPKQFVMTNLCFWGEQYLLEAFLSFNSAFEVVWASSAMQHFCKPLVEASFPGWAGSYERLPERTRVFTPTLDGRNVWPCSFWIKRMN